MGSRRLTAKEAQRFPAKSSVACCLHELSDFNLQHPPFVRWKKQNTRIYQALFEALSALLLEASLIE